MSKTKPAQLVLRDEPTKTAALSKKQPLTIGRAANNLLCMPTTDGVANHHAVVRWSDSNGWLICDWGSQEGTYLEGQRIRKCRPLNNGDEISLGSRGPVLIFQNTLTKTKSATETTEKKSRSDSLQFGKQIIQIDQIKSVLMDSRPVYPASFSWWALISLGLLVLLPWQNWFWILELVALSCWIILGSRKEHVLRVTLKNGMGFRHSFNSKVTALSHLNGIRKTIGQSAEQQT